MTHLPSTGAPRDADQPAQAALTSIPSTSSLTPSQRGELELAKARAERAAAGRTRTAPGGTTSAGKRARGGAGNIHHNGDASVPASDEDDGGEQSDGDLELSRLSPEEQERLLSSRLAGGSSNDKDARRLKRLLRNRVSAQQARERKKQYVSSLEEQIREQQAHMGLMEARLEELEAQNAALRNIIRTMRGFADAPAPPYGDNGAGGGGAGRRAELGPGAPADNELPRDAAGRPGRPAGPVGGSPRATQPPPQLAAVQEGPAPTGMQHVQAQPDAEQGQGQQHQRQRQAPASRNSRARLLPPHTAAPGDAPGHHAAGVAAGRWGGGDSGAAAGAAAAAVPSLPHGLPLSGGAMAPAPMAAVQLLMRPGVPHAHVPAVLQGGGGGGAESELELEDAGVVPLGLESADYMADMG